MKNSNEVLNDLVSVARDGREFYEHAATRVKDPELKALFERIAVSKGEIVRGLSNEVRSTGDTPSTSGTLAGEISQFYGDIRAHLGTKDYAYVAQLEQSEDRLLEAFRKAMESDETTAHARSVIAGLLPDVKSCHDAMAKRKLALKNAA